MGHDVDSTGKQPAKVIKLPTTPIVKSPCKSLSPKQSDTKVPPQQSTAAVNRRTTLPPPPPSTNSVAAAEATSNGTASTPPHTDNTAPSRAISLESVTSVLKSCLFVGSRSTSPHDKMIRPAICKVPMKEVSSFCISLSGCGFLGSYHFGATSCLVKNGEPVLKRLSRVSGASAGSLVGSLFLLAPEKLDTGLEILYDMADELNSLKFGALTPGYFLNEKLIRVVEEQLPVDISPAQKRLVISVTNYKTRKNELISEFSSREHLIKSLLASSYIPMYSMGYAAEPPVIDGKAYIDGGYTNNLPDFEDVRTITISPFSGCADISPLDSTMLEWKMTLGSQHMNVNLQNIVRGAQALFPPNREVLKGYYDKGYKDTFRFLLENGLLKRPIGSPV